MVGALLGAAGPAVGGAQDQSVEDARRQREATLEREGPGRRAARPAAGPGGPGAHGTADLDEALAVQEAKIATATAELGTAEARLEGAAGGWR